MSILKVLVSGATGFIGTPLVKRLQERGDEVLVLSRKAGEGRVLWDPVDGSIDINAIDTIDAVVHLAGESIAGLWTAGKKRSIIESRRAGTTLLAETVAALEPRPRVFVSSGAIGIYGSRGSELLTEDSGVGEGFLAEVVSGWESAAKPAREAAIRTVNLRIGLVLGKGGGMLGPVTPLFKIGAAGRLGSGSQWWSWVTLNDVLRAFLFAIDDDQAAGPYNVAAPNPVTNLEFTKAMGKVLRRPTVLPVPAFLLKTVMREMAEEMLLSSQRVDSSRIERAGFSYEDPKLIPALERVLR